MSPELTSVQQPLTLSTVVTDEHFIYPLDRLAKGSDFRQVRIACKGPVAESRLAALYSAKAKMKKLTLSHVDNYEPDEHLIAQIVRLQMRELHIIPKNRGLCDGIIVASLNGIAELGIYEGSSKIVIGKQQSFLDVNIDGSNSFYYMTLLEINKQISQILKNIYAKKITIVVLSPMSEEDTTALKEAHAREIQIVYHAPRREGRCSVGKFQSASFYNNEGRKDIPERDSSFCSF